MDCIKLFNLINPYKLAKLLGVPASTIYSWKQNGIPKWRISAILEACKKIGLDVSHCLD